MHGAYFDIFGHQITLKIPVSHAFRASHNVLVEKSDDVCNSLVCSCLDDGVVLEVSADHETMVEALEDLDWGTGITARLNLRLVEVGIAGHRDEEDRALGLLYVLAVMHASATAYERGCLRKRIKAKRVFYFSFFLCFCN